MIAPESGHINTHEAGAVEAAGHKINAVQCREGKLTAQHIQEVLDLHTDEHMVKPGAVLISQTTELGTVYSLRELEEIATICFRKDLILYLDGARLGYALASPSADFTLSDIARLVDVFCIGGTKNGGLYGEAVVIKNQQLQKDFRFYMKRAGALLAKGRYMGVQFHELFKDGLYLKLAREANLKAAALAGGIKRLGFQFLVPPVTNQLFVILPNALIEKLRPNNGFYVWSKVDAENSVVRLVTTWATGDDAISSFLTDLGLYSNKAGQPIGS